MLMVTGSDSQDCNQLQSTLPSAEALHGHVFKVKILVTLMSESLRLHGPPGSFVHGIF